MKPTGLTPNTMSDLEKRLRELGKHDALIEIDNVNIFREAADALTAVRELHPWVDDDWCFFCGGEFPQHETEGCLWLSLGGDPTKERQR